MEFCYFLFFILFLEPSNSNQSFAPLYSGYPCPSQGPDSKDRQEFLIFNSPKVLNLRPLKRCYEETPSPYQLGCSLGLFYYITFQSVSNFWRRIWLWTFFSTCFVLLSCTFWAWIVVQNHVQIKFPEPTKLGLEFLSTSDQTFNVCPEADMLLSMTKPKSYSSFSEWGRGWADPAIRRERLKRRRHSVDKSQGSRPRKGRKRKFSKHNSDLKTVRGRLCAKLSAKKWWIKVAE